MIMKHFLQFLLAAVALVSLGCCTKPEEGESQTEEKAPTSITLSESSFEVPQASKSLSLTVTAPARPTVSGLPSWIKLTDGTFSKYKITFTLTVQANDTYEERSATLTVAAAGATSVTCKVKQAAKEKEVEPDPPTPGQDNEAIARAKELGIGWNMGNQLDAINNGVSNETCWGNPAATQATFNGVKEAGFTSVRIPVTWMGHIGPAPDYKIEDEWMNRVYEVVGYAEKAGLKVILNTHHDEDHGDNHWQHLKNAVDNAESNKQIKEEIAAVWTQIANKFKDKCDFLMLESFNELIYGSEWSLSSNQEKKAGVINEWNQVFVDAVRATGGNNATRWLGVPGYAANPQYLKYFTLPNDPAKKTMVAFHCYDPYDYTIGDKQLPDWGHTGTSYKNGEAEIRNLFSSLYNNYIAKNIPIYMGEFGCSFRDKNNTKAWSFSCIIWSMW